MLHERIRHDFPIFDAKTELEKKRCFASTIRHAQQVVNDLCLIDSQSIAKRKFRETCRHVLAPGGGVTRVHVAREMSAWVVKLSAKNSSSGSLHKVVKSRRAASTIAGTPQA